MHRYIQANIQLFLHMVSASPNIPRDKKFHMHHHEALSPLIAFFFVCVKGWSGTILYCLLIAMAGNVEWYMLIYILLQKNWLIAFQQLIWPTKNN